MFDVCIGLLASFGCSLSSVLSFVAHLEALPMLSFGGRHLGMALAQQCDLFASINDQYVKGGTCTIERPWCQLGQRASLERRE